MRSRISKATGRSWDQAALVMFTKVRLPGFTMKVLADDHVDSKSKGRTWESRWLSKRYSPAPSMMSPNTSNENGD
jgi:hypothetical protein